MPNKLTQEEVIKRFEKVHSNKYNYDEVDYINQHIKVKIICLNKNHGVFDQRPHAHISGAGCPKCAHEKHSRRLISNTECFTEEINYHL